jgi:uncharacterized protein
VKVGESTHFFTVSFFAALPFHFSAASPLHRFTERVFWGSIMDQELTEIRIKRVIGPTNTGYAILLGDEDKTFVMFIGIYEGTAIIRELNHEEPLRPLTHELMGSIFEGFELKIKHIVLADIVDNTFRATLVMEQKCADESGEWTGRRNEVHIDARPSDCLVLSLKQKAQIFVTKAVLDKVRDISEDFDFSPLLPGWTGSSLAKDIFHLKDLDITGLQDLPGLFGEDEEEE